MAAGKRHGQLLRASCSSLLISSVVAFTERFTTLAAPVSAHFTEQRCLDLLRRLAGALTQCRLAIHDFTATGHRPADEPFPALFSALMLAWTQHGEAYPLATYQRLLAEAGFRAPEVSDVSAARPGS